MPLFLVSACFTSAHHQRSIFSGADTAEYLIHKDNILYILVLAQLHTLPNAPVAFDCLSDLSRYCE